MQEAYLILENGRVFKGKSFGASGTAIGELVFTTAMTGCAESLTDPSYFGQIVIYTFPQLGNYGISPLDMESSRIHARGIVVREFCESPSNFRSEKSVGDFLYENNIIGISDVDTRELTQIIRDSGALNAIITTEDIDFTEKALKEYRVTNSVEETSVKSFITLMPEGDWKYSVALIDYGAKKSIANSLLKRGCKVTIYPYDTSAETILQSGHDGVMLSNGPGDPADNVFAIGELKKLIGKLPIFGICLGHQLLALAAGGETKKLKFGHRGANQPVRDTISGRIFITSQNHGYAVDTESLEGSGAVLRYANVNDGTCEGLDYPEYKAFSMQFHPEAHGGPLDCEGSFDRFIEMMEDKNA